MFHLHATPQFRLESLPSKPSDNGHRTVRFRAARGVCGGRELHSCSSRVPASSEAGSWMLETSVGCYVTRHPAQGPCGCAYGRTLADPHSYANVAPHTARRGSWPGHSGQRRAGPSLADREPRPSETRPAPPHGLRTRAAFKSDVEARICLHFSTPARNA